MKVPIISEVKNQGVNPEYLFWIGCAGSFDERSKKVTKAFIKILNKANVSFAILGKEESCTGDPAKRAGNEFLFQMKAISNIEILNSYKVKKIVTTCPHCGSNWIDQPPTSTFGLYMRFGESHYSKKENYNYKGRIAGNGYYYDFRAAYDGELQFAVRDWGPGPTHKYIKWYTDNSGSFLLDVFVYDLEQKEGFKRFLRAMIQNNPEDLMFTAQAQAFLK